MMRVLILAFLLTGCAAQAPDMRAGLSRAAIDRSAQPLMLAEIVERGLVAKLVPAGSRDGVTTWRTGQRQTLAFRGGVLIATRGLGNDLMSADVAGTLAALAGGPQSDYARLMTYLDGDVQTEFRAMLCRMGPPAATRTGSYGLSFATTLRIETCRMPGLTVENRYWQEADGTMRRSEQWIGPGGGPLVIEWLSRQNRYP
jgi:hypothetical protein